MGTPTLRLGLSSPQRGRAAALLALTATGLAASSLPLLSLPPTPLARATPAWMSPGAFVEYSGFGYLNLSGPCMVRSDPITLRWEVSDLDRDSALLALRLELPPPLRLRGECGGLNLDPSKPLTLESELEVDLPSRRATWRGEDLGLIPLWIEGLVPGAEVEVSGPVDRPLVGLVDYHEMCAKVGVDGRALRVFEVRVSGREGLEELYWYDATTGILLRLLEGEVDLEEWPLLRSLGVSAIDLIHLEVADTNVRLSEANPLLSPIYFGGRWVLLAPRVAAVAPLAGLALLTAARGGLRGALGTRAGRLLLALLVASLILAALWTPLWVG